MLKAVLFRSQRRFDAFYKRLRDANVEVTVLDFDSADWVEHEFHETDIVIYFPEFTYTSNHPQALYRVQDNLMHIHRLNPRVKMFPDPAAIGFYSDKYRQYLFLKAKQIPFPETYALVCDAAIDEVEQRLGYPMVLKNRFGAGGDFVFRVDNRRQLDHYYRLSQLDLFRFGALLHYGKMLLKREFYYHLVRQRRMAYPFLAPPLLAQKFVPHDRDIKTVVGDGKVVEAHWRRKASEGMWKVNIDGGGIGEWSYVPPEIISLSEQLAAEIGTAWLNIDIIQSNGRYLVTEFSPVWHHYAYKEKPSFVYKDDYNIDMPLEISLDLERIIVDSLVNRARQGGSSR
jgi:glutathione synthase/RimK-type ligase-like ATP-grasp enzyme